MANKRKDFLITAAEVERLCNEYFDECDEAGKKYSVPGLCMKLDLIPKQYEQILRLYTSDDKEVREECQLIHAKKLYNAHLRICDDLEQRTDTMSLFRSKQSIYCGYTDKQESSAGNDIKVTVKLEGMPKGVNPGA